MSSMHAFGIRSFASRSARARRLLSRDRCSASTIIPKRASKSISWLFGSSRCAAHAAAIAPRCNAWSFSIVGSVSMSPPSSVVVVAPTHVLVRERETRLLVGARHAIEAVLEDRLDVPVRACPDAHGAVARRFQAHLAVTLAQPQDPQARAEALLGMGAIGENRLAQLACRRADLSRPSQDARWRPFGVRAMRARHVLGLRREASFHVR